MGAALGSLDEILSSVDRLRRSITKKKSKQVTASEERTVVKAVSLSWFNTHRPILMALHDDALLQGVDRSFQDILESSDRATSRTRYGHELKVLRTNLLHLRSQAALLGNAADATALTTACAPDFSKLISDTGMQQILVRRWAESQKCLAGQAYLAATVMMGSLLEALLLARMNRLTEKSPAFGSKCAPKDKSGKTRPLQEWTLSSFIDVAHDLGWIRKAARDVGVVLRDYRNFIHPEKEFTHGVTLEENDARMFWVIFTQLCEQIVKS
ncbi:hypothetical protein [Anaerobaca lacustris]|uniref:Uncharacterized protein n=1 Tax=Anaerobaca lacustris TaxID=3044600 RepID=A0AAW6TUW0_9BACT|nr:hypothetical protein [Sedimentisphaerales bacterium M17dextr]